MKGTQTALALGLGYVLGRRRKMRLTMMLAAAAAASGGLDGVGGGALRRGMKMLGSTEALGKVSPQLAEIVDTVRGDLLDAGKAAAVAAATKRIGSLSDTLHKRAQSIRASFAVGKCPTASVNLREMRAPPSPLAPG